MNLTSFGKARLLPALCVLVLSASCDDDVNLHGDSGIGGTDAAIVASDGANALADGSRGDGVLTGSDGGPSDGARRDGPSRTDGSSRVDAFPVSDAGARCLANGAQAFVLEAAGHSHSLLIDKTDFANPRLRTYTLGRNVAHTHQLTINATQFIATLGGKLVRVTTTADQTGHLHEAILVCLR